MMYNFNENFILIKIVKEILKDIEVDILKEGEAIIIVDSYNWYKEVLSLMAKQVNLCDSCMLLLENGMEQEAYLLVRSQFNNFLWIKYLCEEVKEDRVKEYISQQYIDQKLHNKSIIKMIDEFECKWNQKLDLEKIKMELRNKNKHIVEEMKKANLEDKFMNISELAKQDEETYGMYITLYHEASKIEHSNIDIIKQNRKKIIEGYNEDMAFSLDLSSSNIKDWLKVFMYSFICISKTLEVFTKRIKNHERHLLEIKVGGKTAYNEDAFDRIFVKIRSCQKEYDKIEKKHKKDN